MLKMKKGPGRKTPRLQHWKLENGCWKYSIQTAVGRAAICTKNEALWCSIRAKFFVACVRFIFLQEKKNTKRRHTEQSYGCGSNWTLKVNSLRMISWVRCASMGPMW